MTCRLDEVDAGMHTVVDDIHPVDLVFGIQVCIKASLDVVDDWFPGVVIVDKVSKTGGIDNR